MSEVIFSVVSVAVFLIVCERMQWDPLGHVIKALSYRSAVIPVTAMDRLVIVFAGILPRSFVMEYEGRRIRRALSEAMDAAGGER